MNAIFKKLTGGASAPIKTRYWFYQYPNEPVKQITKKGRNWNYTFQGGGGVSTRNLRDAKGDLRYGGAKVWSELK